MNIIKIRKFVKYILRFYIIYAFIFGVLLFGLYNPASTEELEDDSIEVFHGQELSQDRVVLMEERNDSGVSRVNLIENAEKTLDIAYYTLHDGVSTDIFFSSIIEAADRGIKVRILLDGIFHNLNGNLRGIRYIFSAHPNIELRFYEPLNLIKPWTWNNRLHDKFIIVDEKYAIIGGRNIGDKYFIGDETDDHIVYDRDVVIINTDEGNVSNSVISEFKDYFNHLWDHDYSKSPVNRLTNMDKRKGEEKYQYLVNRVEKLEKTHPEIFNNSIDWIEESVPVNKISLIYNPIERLNKEPWCWYYITNLANNAEESIYVQSPYIIPTKDMLNILHVENISVDREQINILTNSIHSSPNPFAISGYMNNRKRVVDFVANVYEFQGPGSIHAKSYIFDNRISAVGSFNFDSRSAFLSTESMVIIDSKDFAKHLEEEMDKYISNSLIIGEDYSYLPDSVVEEGEIPLLKLIVVRVLSVVVYLFQFML
ncbi:phospholipase D-like domain-containing protein [Clostridium sp. Cult2]|uniref:phospholipase D-like domain-containing protein n=1 Tax=Clostridium sp. Cult2 TaxID=2079003 RepID=UPI001F4261D2|nr:phospholipase D family protein [Clostridium sp. Cult2]MCF6464857.1 phospholipase [Clostridium sp. Cult2]